MSPKSINTILAIESAIAGGSLSLMRDGIEIGNWISDDDVSKGEELLVNIDELLRTTSTSKKDIDLIAVSAGPGSFTGIRIGIATALGLKNGLCVPMASQSAMHVIAATERGHEILTVAVPMGRKAVCVQSFSTLNTDPAPIDASQTMKETDFFDLAAGNSRKGSYIVHSVLFEMMEPSPKTVDFGRNIAHAIGLMCSRYPDVTTDPLFISKSF